MDWIGLDMCTDLEAEQKNEAGRASNACVCIQSVKCVWYGNGISVLEPSQAMPWHEMESLE